MLSFGIRYLNGFTAATEPDSHDRAEWPPHPGRVFMALTAAHFQTGANLAEREALTWLEELSSAPVIRAGECIQRAIVTHYVPVNDRAVWKKDPAKPKGKPSPPLQSAPGIMRDRQPRTFARAFLQDDTVYISWPSAEPTEHIRDALSKLCAKVTRIGHSSSLVQMWIAKNDRLPEPNWVPADERATIYMRVPGPGTLRELEQYYNGTAVERFSKLAVLAEDDSDKQMQKESKTRLKQEFADNAPAPIRPVLSRYQGYAPQVRTGEKATAQGTVLSPYPLVLTLNREEGPYHHLDLLKVLTVTQRWREAILANCNDIPNGIRALLSGHNQDGSVMDGPHLAFLPFAFVGHEHADARLLGMAMALPADLSRDDRRAALRVIGSVQQLALGRLGLWRIVPSVNDFPSWNLHPHAWTAHPAGATHWSSVTPVVFDKHPKADRRSDYQQEVAGIIAEACARIGLPKPREVIVTAVSAHLGVPPAFAFPRLCRKDGSERRHAHVIIVFDKPVCGPVLIGAGRYRGYGFCRPLGESGKEIP